MAKLGYRFEQNFNRFMSNDDWCINDSKYTKATRYGITDEVASEYGYKGEIKNLPLELIKEIYKHKYWDALRLDEILSNSVCKELFDSAINVGVSRAGKWLQIALNVFNAGGKRWEDLYVDGVVGEKTIKIVNEATSISRWNDLIAKGLEYWQGQYYMELLIAQETHDRFIVSWFAKKRIHPY